MFLSIPAAHPRDVYIFIKPLPIRFPIYHSAYQVNESSRSLERFGSRNISCLFRSRTFDTCPRGRAEAKSLAALKGEWTKEAPMSKFPSVMRVLRGEKSLRWGGESLHASLENCQNNVLLSIKILPEKGWNFWRSLNPWRFWTTHFDYFDSSLYRLKLRSRLHFLLGSSSLETSTNLRTANWPPEAISVFCKSSEERKKQNSESFRTSWREEEAFPSRDVRFRS